MRKFNRVNKNTGEEIAMVGTSGTILSIAAEPKLNSNGKPYHIFTANVNGTRGKFTCMGQVYESAFEFLGGKPEIGDKFGFAASEADLQAKNNKLWSISGVEVDEISEELLDDLDAI